MHAGEVLVIIYIHLTTNLLLLSQTVESMLESDTRAKHLSDSVYSIPFAQPTGLMDSPESRTIAAALCKAKCLKECVDNMKQKAVTNPTIGEVLKALTAVPTQLRSECVRLSPGLLFYEECDQACEADRPYNDCIVMCETGDSPGGWSCLSGCRFLDAALKERSGECPPQGGPAIHRLPEFMSKSNRVQNGNGYMKTAQIKLPDHPRCTVDAECLEKHEKCCHSQCKKAVFRDDIIPPLPTVQILESKSPPSFLLSWERGLDLSKSNLSDPTVYVLQVKTYFGQEFDSRLASDWKTLFMSTLTGAQLSEPRVGWWYQFQVAGVNRWGSLGFEVPSPPVQLSNPKPGPPSPPRDLVDHMLKMQSDGDMSVQIRWSPPAEMNIPVTEYRVYWGPDEPQSPEESGFSIKPTEFVNTVPATETSLQLTNLKPDALYRVQVIAMSQWGTTQLRSLPSNLFVKTPPITHFKNSNVVKQQFMNTDTRKNIQKSNLESRNDQCICDGKTKSAILSRSRHKSNESRYHFFTTPAFYDGTDIRVRATLIERVPDPDSENSLSDDYAVHIKWTPQVCIDTKQVDEGKFMRLTDEQELNSLANSRNANTLLVKLHPVLLNNTQVRQADFFLTGLRLNCRYLLEITESSGTKLELRACLCTPACSELQTSSWISKQICEAAEKPHSVLEQPRGLNSHLIGGKQLIYNITWLPGTSPFITDSYDKKQKSLLDIKPAERSSWQLTQPEPAEKYHPVKYRVVWGPSRDKPISPSLWQVWPGLRPRLDPNQAETKVLQNGETSLVIGPLVPKTQYIVKLQALSTKPNQEYKEQGNTPLLTSEESFMFFETPPVLTRYDEYSPHYPGSSSSSSFIHPDIWSTIILLVTSLTWCHIR